MINLSLNKPTSAEAKEAVAAADLPDAVKRAAEILIDGREAEVPAGEEMKIVIVNISTSEHHYSVIVNVHSAKPEPVPAPLPAKAE